MDFENLNPLNYRLNLISGNLLPMTGDNTPQPLVWRIYRVLTWSLNIFVTIAIIVGCIYMPKDKDMTEAVVYMVIIAEMFFIVTRFYAYSDVLGQLICHLNDILRSADDIMENVVTETIQPVQFPLTIYCFTASMTELALHVITMLLLFEKDVFWYEDEAYPAAFFAQPLSSRTFFLSNVIIAVSSFCACFKKLSADIYIVHMVLMITAQYRYSTLKLAQIFQNQNENIDYESRKADSYNWTKTELRALCQHHNALFNMSLLLKEVLSLMCVVLHINAVLRFCFLGINTVIYLSEDFWHIFFMLIYLSGAIIQLYILCSCVQQLSDASTEVTNEAFHQEWYLSDPSTKKIFMFIIMANNLECKLAVVDNFNLILPSFMKILNQAYSVALLFLKMQ